MGYRAIRSLVFRYCKMDPTIFLRLEILRRRRVVGFIMLLINIIIHCTALLLLEARNDPQPYHTSILTGGGWLIELLLGHPDRIRCELGVRKHVFEALVNELRSMGYGDNRSVCLEEQLGIFLYSCVTGLTVRHVGERFQRSNETVARCVSIQILIPSTVVPTSMYIFS
jgi:hypothetical protein